MPQMSPMNWLFLMLFNLMNFLIFMFFLYFFSVEKFYLYNNLYLNKEVNLLIKYYKLVW